MEFALSHINHTDVDKIEEIEKTYCNLMNTYNNHITFDYYTTISRANESIQTKKNWKGIKHIYYWEVLWRQVVKTSIIILPIILYIARGFFNL